MRTSRLRVQLREVEPTVVRVLDVPARSTLPELHRLLQVGMGWVDVHLHQFDAGNARYGTDDGSDDGFGDSPGSGDEPVWRDEAAHTLADLGARWVYRYDFGDGWTHDVEVLGLGADRPGCIYGEEACPPEDCGGSSGFEQLRAALADPGHEEHAAMREWAGGPLPDFDQAATDLLVRQTVGAVPESVRLLLDAIGEGVKLTPGGRLPRRVLHALQEHRPEWSLTGRPAHLEEDLIPLTALHDVLRGVGLLRPRHGVLRATKAAGDDLEVLRRLRSWFGPEESFTALLATDTVALLAAHGTQSRHDLPARLLELLGPGWARGGAPLTADDITRQLTRAASVLEGLDQLTRRPGGLWEPGPGASWLLPRAAALASLWRPVAGAAAQPHYAR